MKNTRRIQSKRGPSRERHQPKQVKGVKMYAIEDEVSVVNKATFAKAGEYSGRFKTCPWCGRDPEVFVGDSIIAVRCRTQGCFNPNGNAFIENAEGLIEDWNTRATK